MTQRLPRQEHTALLEVSDLSLRFTRRSGWFRQSYINGLCNVSLSVARGEVHAVVGASGAGKSLLAWAVMGLLPANARCTGTLRFDGQPLDASRQARLRGRSLALVPQSVAALDPLARCGDQLRWAAQRAGIPTTSIQQRVARVLGQYGLEPGVTRAYPHTLSGGMARRVLLAMASIGDADLIIADEPTVGLDHANRERVLGYLRDLAAAGKAVLLITHDLRHALKSADHVTVMRSGTTVECAKAHQFSGEGSQLTTAYARALWQALPSNAFLQPRPVNPVNEAIDLA
ncbi:ATP-binding cassette domain-containing protein [Litchfieldella xinjiangensis]|uniref:ATP-binding cassette domain-containing protein n=1 Tax=Litchfieldella xinjiangensis TaxID=1166948 RepID=UPI000B0564BC|nr:ATP-binding cassette domain-containing protein [Halomonas xinjiangensis]